MYNNPLSTLFKKKRGLQFYGCVFKLINKLSIVEAIYFSFNNNCEVYSSCLVEIGDNSIFSNNCVIRDSDIHKMVSDGAMVAAGSVVTKDVLHATLIAVNPARVIKNNIEWE